MVDWTDPTDHDYDNENDSDPDPDPEILCLSSEP
jgi:hypothetical protein